MNVQNGDQMQYEIDNAKIPKEQRSDWPLPSFDARDWAKAFNQKHPSVAVDDALAWFACALTRGCDEGYARASRDWPDMKLLKFIARWNWAPATIALVVLLLAGCATSPAAKMHVVMTGNPPQYFSGIVTYRNNHVQKLIVGSDRFLSCADALRDTGPALTKAIEAPDGWAAKGICIPVPTLDVSDLVPRSMF